MVVPQQHQQQQQQQPHIPGLASAYNSPGTTKPHKEQQQHHCLVFGSSRRR